MCFSTLPDEVLLLIISETTLITYLKEPLVSLARVNRCLRHLVTPVLYDNVSVSLHNKDFDLFKRSVTADSYLASLVRTLTLETPPSSWWEEHQGSTESHRCALVLLQSLPALLSLDLMDRIHIPYPSSPQLNHVLLPSLRRVDLPRETTTNDIARFVLLPNVERVVVATHDSGDHDMIPSLPPGIKFGSSPLKYLKFGGTSMPDAAMHKLLSLPRSLEELSCDFDETALPVMFSPICILRALAPVRQTLVKLRLTGERISDVDECDKSRMDFSGFTSLRKLKIMSRLLFLWNEQDTLSRRCELYKRLPTGLEYLRMEFEAGDCILQDWDDSIIENHRHLTVHNYQWILELALHKGPHFSHLQEVDIRETHIRHGLHNIPFGWDPPEALAQPYRAAGINLSIALRRKRRKRLKFNLAARSWSRGL